MVELQLQRHESIILENGMAHCELKMSSTHRSLPFSMCCSDHFGFTTWMVIWPISITHMNEN